MAAPTRLFRPRFLALGAVLAVLSALMISWLQQALYPAPPVGVPAPPAPLTEVSLPLPTGEAVVGWAWEPAGRESAPVVLFFHGNGENLETMRMAGLYEEIAGLGVAFLAVDYPGYGRSGGQPSEEGLVATGEAALAWAVRQHPRRPRVACGWSLGAAVAAGLAAAHGEDLSGLIALSPWTSLREVARVHVPFGLADMLLRERYDSLAAAGRIRLPALVVHGGLDDIIPFSQGERFAAALPPGTTRFVPVPRAGHNDLLAQPAVWQEMAAFLRGLEVSSP